ncbi:MAG TPA: tetratricopeptide repeat protein [Vicinamibacterales bacterium]|nr:tetratricopeptide repeat protein [Vicinamibacterales bacterium]
MNALRLQIVPALLLALLAACAPKAPAPVTAPAVPRFPEFVFPTVEPPAAERLLEDHQAAWYLLQGGDARNAERRYAAVLKRRADFHPAHAGLGYVALSRKEYKAALEHFERALALRPRYAPALAGQGQTYLAMGDRARALASFDAALAADPGLVSVRSAADVLRFQGLQGGVAGARKAAQEGRLAEARSGYLAAIQASPDSPFLYRELADVERREGNLDAALEHARKAVSLDPNEPRSHLVLAEILEAQGQFTAAADALAAAAALEPADALTERIEALRARASFEAMPEEYRRIEQEPSITRAQLAALLGVRLEDLVRRAPRRGSPVITDIRGNWAAQWILAVTRAGFMEVFPNHTFQPGATVRRGDLAFAASRVLSIIAAENPRLGTAWRSARPRFPDLPAGHLSYPAAAVAVEAGVMKAAENGAFQLTRPVSGAEAAAAVDRLLELATRRK